MPSAVIFGAGKIGRGFIGQLLHRAGYSLFFVDATLAVVQLLQERAAYHVHVAGNAAQDEAIPVAGAALLADARWHQQLCSCDLVASAVGAANIDVLCAMVAPVLSRRKKTLDWLICENADKPAQRMRRLLGREGQLGLVETQILRSGMQATPEQLAGDPLAVRVHDWWTLPCDAEAFVADIPNISGLQPHPNFGNELQRKLYTFNGLNGPIAYLGAEHGHHFLHQAARDPALQELLDGVQEESAHGLINEYGFDAEEHRAFQRLARAKYETVELQDPIARNAADSARKLGPRERLLGPALLCLKHARFPHAYVQAIVAALRYTAADDEGTARLQALLQDEGPAAVLARCGQLPVDHPLSRAVVELFQQTGALR